MDSPQNPHPYHTQTLAYSMHIDIICPQSPAPSPQNPRSNPSHIACRSTFLLPNSQHSIPKMKMALLYRDVLELIHQYRREMEDLETQLREMNNHFSKFLDVAFDTRMDIRHFARLLDTPLAHATFLSFTGRCTLCHDCAYGYWTYVDFSTPLVMRGLVRFLSHLKDTGFLCIHEIVTGVRSSRYICVLEINATRTVQEAQTPSQRFNYRDLRIEYTQVEED